MLHIPDLTPLLTTLEKISAGRIIAGVEEVKTGTGVILRIPVRTRAAGDRADVEARRYIRSWLKGALKEQEGLRITTQCVPVNPYRVSWIPPSGDPIPVSIMLEVQIDLTNEGEVDRWKREKERKHAAEKKEFYEGLTVKSTDS